MSYMIVVVDDDAEHVHPYICLTYDSALESFKQEIRKMFGKDGDGEPDFFEKLEAATTFDALYHLVDGAHWGENDIKILHVIDLATATAVF
jgi:hypothetical protein